MAALDLVKNPRWNFGLFSALGQASVPHNAVVTSDDIITLNEGDTVVIGPDKPAMVTIKNVAKENQRLTGFSGIGGFHLVHKTQDDLSLGLSLYAGVQNDERLVEDRFIIDGRLNLDYKF